ncbi:hypothetical protein ACA910_019938 [Epithemia clementina (nom. ined.)]
MSNEAQPWNKGLADEMTPDERLTWLRQRGVQVVTSEERRASQVAGALREAESLSTTTTTASSSSPFSYVLVPADSSKPLVEVHATQQPDWKGGDFLLEYLKPSFRSGGQEVDLSMLNQQAAQTLAASSNNGLSSVSDTALRKVAQEGNVESFSLVHATPSNDFTGVNVYLDEIGILKRLPLNTRMMDMAKRAGFDPAPQFYGDVFLGRVQKQGSRIQNTSFCLGEDTDVNHAPWLQSATRVNLEYQSEINRLSGRDYMQPAMDGADGKAKQEDSFYWTQTEEELEISVPLPNCSSPKDVQVKFLPQSLTVTFQGEIKVALPLFQPVDVDGCTWTIDRSSNDTATLHVTMEKGDAAMWPRVRD